MVPGHEIVGVVDALGPGASRFAVGERIGIAWLRGTCGTCRFCVRGDENLCLAPSFTGWDADGGYAEHAVVDERYAYRLPEAFADAEAAPLLCAGIIGYRALRRAELPPGGRLGHLRLRRLGPPGRPGGAGRGGDGVRHDPVGRGPGAGRRPRRAPGRATPSTGPPEPLDSAICFAPAGEIVPAALEALDRGGTLAVAGIHLSDIPPLDYQRHLFQERQVRSVTANTRQDGEDFLAIAARIGIRVTTTPVPAGRRPTGPWPTWPTTGSTAPPSSRSSRRLTPRTGVDASRRARRIGARTMGDGP